MKSSNAQAKPSTEPAFRISWVFDAPRELVWQAWTEPKRMAQWWGPRVMTTPVCELHVRVGGAYRIVMRAPDGTEYPMEGVFREVVAPERLVLTMDCSGHPDAWHDMVNPNRDKSKKPSVDLLQTITFENVSGKTRLTVCTTFASIAIRDAMLKMGMNEGWSESLDRLAELLARAR